MEKKFIPVMLTPFKENGEIDFDGLTRLTEMYLDAGVKGLFANCQSSEMFELSDDEKLRIVKHVMKIAGARVPVVAVGNFGKTIVKQADFIKRIYDTGVQAAIIVTGLIALENEPPEIFEERVFQLFELTGKIPLGFYECPEPYKRVLTAEQLKTFVANGRIIYHKDTCLDIELVREKLKATKAYPSFGLYDAYVVNAVDALKAGAAGLSCIQGNFFPELIVWLCEHYKDDSRIGDVHKVQYFLKENMEVMHNSYPATAKYYLQKSGLNISIFTRSKAGIFAAGIEDELDRLFDQYHQLKKTHRNTGIKITTMKRPALLYVFTAALLFCIVIVSCCEAQGLPAKTFTLMQITHDASGHTINNTQCFSPGDEWIVYDTRNDDSQISSTGTIAMVNTHTGEIKELYHTQHQTSYGPGVGAATFSPTRNRVLFIHGIGNSNKNNPYSFTRRTGVAVDINNPFHPLFMDARNIIPPFTPGALRGGTHAHTWNADGKWISFTYNDYIMEQLAKTDSSVKDLRTVGVMIPGHAVSVPIDSAGENNNGETFAVVVAKVTEDPAPGSDEIRKAFDEGWIGAHGYQKSDGSWQRHAIAFQGELKKADGTYKTEVFVLDLPENLTKASMGLPLEGIVSSRPNVPEGIIQRRLTYTDSGILGPRHWLRATADGKIIAFLSKDNHGIIQVFGVSPNDGKISQLTFNAHSVQGPFNFSPDGKRLAYLSDNRVYVTDIKTGKSTQPTPSCTIEERPSGSVVWSNNGKMLAFNKFVKDDKKNKYFLQIFLLKAS